MRAEKKMMVGSPWNARKKPRDSSPRALVVPGGSASLPNTNSAPAAAEPITVTTTSFTQRKNFAPGGKTKITSANIIWSAIPQKIKRQFMVLRSDEKSQAIPSNTNIPTNEMRLYKFLITLNYLYYFFNRSNIYCIFFII